MNTDEKALEQTAREVSDFVASSSLHERNYQRILSALHKAVEPYKTENAALRKQVEELRHNLHQAPTQACWLALHEQIQQLQGENERLKSACQKSGDVI